MRPILEKAGPAQGGKQVLKQKCELETTERMLRQVFFACLLYILLVTSEVSGLIQVRSAYHLPLAR